MATSNKYIVFSIQKMIVSYGHWRISLQIQNPNYNPTPNDHESIDSDIEYDDNESIIITSITTESRKIDGYNGFERALAEDCLEGNGFDPEEFDLSGLRESDED